ncbi:hypothetical protein CPHO_06545 [Corynebacterium phocae]|uniref:RDD domain-containing protein n=1 Tax=Corynebacterium phocae TaxID=161895 RepID=A0A1L7D3B0_9CORY|nr:RDD family protein [Corynebacterium phocae]APT92608.1 hypothetical protein CPHO_06545 [Corynebacterium phocae]KAA8724165.1 hypothetical protein F4V58_06080 [Corynebacterium phocae]
MWLTRLRYFIRRVTCLWLDCLVVSPVVALIIYLVARAAGTGDTAGLSWGLAGDQVGAAIFTVVVFVYRWVFEATRNTSLGKLLGNLYVVNTGPPTRNAWVAAAVRNAWILAITAVIAFEYQLGATAPWGSGADVASWENLIPVVLGVCIIIWGKHPFDTWAQARVDRLEFPPAGV